MALNRFFAPGQSQYVSQYVPHKLPFELWQQNLAQKDNQIDAYKQQHSGLYNNEIAGIDEAKLGEYSKEYYKNNPEISKLVTSPESLLINDRKNSQASANQLNGKLDALLTDDFLMQAATGDIADDLIQLQKENLQHKTNNELYKKREEAVLGIYDTIGKTKGEWQNDPTLLFEQERELQKLDPNNPNYDPNYIPKNVGVGKYFDRTSYTLDKVGSKKDSGGKKYDHSDPLYVKWSSSHGVSAGEYAMFVKDLFNDQNSLLYADVQRELNEMTRSGYITSDEERKAAEKSILDDLIATSRNLKHSISDQGERYKSGEERTAIEESKIIEGTGEVNEFAPPQSLNEVKQTVTTLSNQWNTITEELRNLKYGSPEWNKKDIERKNIENQLYQYKAGAALGELDIINKYDPNGNKLNAIQTREINAFFTNNPGVLDKLLTKNEDGSYSMNDVYKNYDLNNDGKINEGAELNKLTSETGLTLETLQSAWDIVKEDVAKGNVEEKINKYKTDGSYLRLYNYVAAQGDTNIEKDTKVQLLNSIGIDTKGMSEDDLEENFDYYVAKGKNVSESNYGAASLRTKYENDLEALRNDKVDASKYDYFTTTTGVRTVSTQELGFLNSDLDVTNSKVVLSDGTVISDPEILKTISNSIYNKGENMTGTVSGNGRVKVSTSISKWDLMTQKERELELAKAKIDIDDATAYSAWKKSLEDQIVVADAYLQGGASTSKTISNNTVTQVLNDPNKTDEEKTTFVTGLTNEQTFRDLNGETSKLIVSYSEGKSNNSSNQVDETEYFVLPNKTINIQMVEGSSYSSVPVNVTRVEMNNDYGSPQLVYTFNINGQELTSTPLPSEDSQAFTDYVTALLYSTQN